MKRGVPPTALNARTGLLTPPGITASARRSQPLERVTRPAAAPGSAPESVSIRAPSSLGVLRTGVPLWLVGASVAALGFGLVRCVRLELGVLRRSRDRLDRGAR